jgi:hypothetical protein
VPVIGSANGSDDAVIEWCWYHPYKQVTDQDLERVMTTFADPEQHGEERAKIWKNYLDAAKNNIQKTIWEMLSECKTPWVTTETAVSWTRKATSTDELDEETDDDELDEETDDEEGNQYGNTFVSVRLPLFAGQAYRPTPPNLGSTFEDSSEHALIIRRRVRNKINDQRLRSWQRDGTEKRLRSIKDASRRAMGNA